MVRFPWPRGEQKTIFKEIEDDLEQIIEIFRDLTLVDDEAKNAIKTFTDEVMAAYHQILKSITPFYGIGENEFKNQFLIQFTQFREQFNKFSPARALNVLNTK
jgi:hypothetical protein